jgi:hypothetical protein
VTKVEGSKDGATALGLGVSKGCGCGVPVERSDKTAMRIGGGWWHRSCWIAEAERRRPELEAQRERIGDRLAVAELLLRAEERSRRERVSGFLGGPGALGVMVAIIAL